MSMTNAAEDRSDRHVVVVGAGAMGSQIGMLCALAGFDATITDIAGTRWIGRKPSCGNG